MYDRAQAACALSTSRIKTNHHCVPLYSVDCASGSLITLLGWVLSQALVVVLVGLDADAGV
jgi:hypothetical protein